MNAEPGWEWLAGHAAESQPKPADGPDGGLARAFTRCFATADGQRVLAHLRRVTLERALGPTATDALLRHLEGQRQLVAMIQAFVAIGKNDA